MDDSDNHRQFWRCRVTVCEMLEDRGYVVSGAEKDEPYDKFLQQFEQGGYQRARMVIIGQKESSAYETGAAHRILVYFTDEAKKIGAKTVKELLERMESRQVQRGVLIGRGEITSLGRDAMSNALPANVIEYFKQAELLINVTKHELVPKHLPLSETEKLALLQHYKITETALPRIQPNDPLTRYFGLHKGEVFKIIRPSETAGRYITYRIVL